METVSRTMGPTFSIREHLESQYLLDLEEAERISAKMIECLRKLPAGTILLVDLDGVITRASCVARFLGGPLKQIRDNRIENRYVVLAGPLDDLTEHDVRMALDDEGLVAAVRLAEGARLIGATARVLEETYNALLRAREVSSAELVDRLGLDIKTANARIAKLESVGLLHREGESTLQTGGRRFVYRLVQ